MSLNLERVILSFKFMVKLMLLGLLKIQERFFMYIGKSMFTS